jgi:integrase
VARINLKSAYRVTSKGHEYWYAWRGKGAPRLFSTPGSDTFIRELNEALSSRRSDDDSKISGLVTLYRSSDDFNDLAKTTKRIWLLWLDRIKSYFGDLSVRQFDKPDIRVEIRKWHRTYKATPRAADYGLQVLSKLLSFAAGEGKLASNPCIGAGIQKLYETNRADIIWTADNLETLRLHASPEIFRAARLGALTGLRQTDLLSLTWSQINDLAIERPTGKSKGRRTALVPLYRDLRAFLATLPKVSQTVLTNSRGRPWQGFGSSWNKAMHASGLNERGLHFHDLRGTAATRLFMADLTVREIAQILAWTEDRVERIIDRYVKRDEILRDRIRRIDEGLS